MAGRRERERGTGGLTLILTRAVMLDRLYDAGCRGPELGPSPSPLACIL